MKTYLKVDESKCKKCSICTTICPSRITISERMLSGLDNKKCCSCLHCYAACPHEAMSMEGMDIYYPEKNNDRSIDDKQLFDFLARRKFSTEGMVSDIIGLDDIVEKGFERLASNKELIKILVAP